MEKENRSHKHASLIGFHSGFRRATWNIRVNFSPVERKEKSEKLKILSREIDVFVCDWWIARRDVHLRCNLSCKLLGNWWIIRQKFQWKEHERVAQKNHEHKEE